MFEDEASISNTATVSYQWDLKGKQPLVKSKQSKRERQTFFGCVALKTGEVVVKRADKGNSKTFKAFLVKTIHHFKGKKVIMVLDNVRYHHAKALKPFLEQNKSKIELLFLPPYSPDLNPMERVWWYMRKKITHNRYTEKLQTRVKYFWQLFSTFKNPNLFIAQLCNINFSV